MIIEKDFLVIGSGIAGLTFALKASQFGSVAIISKNELDESATLYAQGGIASVMTDDDSFEFMPMTPLSQVADCAVKMLCALFVGKDLLT